ncbi:MAG: hypothetical protein LBL98_04930 [Ruminococcus sp.]|jgi:hypothetical protein|nr:hypothetical protein [Ruminococcus sp.]
MKFKKLFAALVAGVLALTIAPMAASAAGTPALTGVKVAGVSASSWSADDGTLVDPFEATVALDYSKVKNTQLSLSYSSLPIGSTLYVGSSSDPSEANAFKYDITPLVTVAQNTSSTVYFKVTDLLGASTFYKLSVYIGSAATYPVTLDPAHGGTINRYQVGKADAAEDDIVSITAPMTNVNGRAISYFTSSVSISSVTSVTKSTKFETTTGVLSFKMPGQAVTLTAYYAGGQKYDGTGGTTTGNKGPNELGQYYVTLKGVSSSYGVSGWVTPGRTVNIYPAYPNTFNYWNYSGVLTLDYLYTSKTNSFTMPRSDVTITADNYNDTTTTRSLYVIHGGDSNTTTYPSTGEWVLVQAGSGWSGRWYTNNTSIFSYGYSATSPTLYFQMPNSRVIISDRASDITNVDDTYGTYSISVGTNGVGSASASKKYAEYGDIITISASTAYNTTGTTTTGSSYYLNDPYYLLFGNGGLGYNYNGYVTSYTFSSWSISGNYEFRNGTTSTSSTAYILVRGSISATANFKANQTAVTPITPTKPATNNNANTFTNGGATSTINTSTGVVTAGVNSSGSLNSTATANAVKSVVSRGLSDSSVTVTLPTSTTAISKSAMQKLITAAGNKDLRIQIQSTYGTILLPMSSARQVMTKISASSSAITSAITKFKKAYGNTDIVGIQTSQSGSFGVSATYRISADAIGLGADYGDKVYIAIYNPTKGTFQRKTVTINAKGEIAFASSSSGIILFSSYPFSK